MYPKKSSTNHKVKYDIGILNMRKNGCKYCYANYSSNTVAKNILAHGPNSPRIAGKITPDNIVKDCVVKACKNCQ
jgi:hypothetical protein